MNVLVVAPHPDDEVLGCGGTIARHTQDGDTVDIVVVTRGDDRYDQAWIRKSREEALQAHQMLGVAHTGFLDYPSPTLDTVPASLIAERISRLGPYDVAYIPHAGDVHQEHRIVHHACLVAFRPPGPNVYAYETLSSTEWGSGFSPDHFVDITGSYLNRKREAMRCYATQLQDAPSPRSIDGINALAHVRGMTVQRVAAEAFVTVRTVR